ncbi:LysR family transcriptional regulator [Noviherbaspirillum saxi]|uniref:LysR family transcriptional regulator n=1 Tax=Noviherbaspirillum saxi TaxID=2320863 RepID=A0A3A3FJ16_9BURK|nr:LysR family transcriptional regulator [Noviherbaspirillum saxi]RJF92534.1 LysR family transcriptional regulator [Noviherbaspirillum saxi]
MAIDLRSMRSFVAVASAGSISRAAEHLHIAQPALSLQIKNIEEHLGAQLFERTTKGVTPTAAGQRFLVHIIDILKRVDVAYEDVREAVNEPTGRVALGLSHSMSKILTIPLVSAILRRWPKIQFQMIEMSTGYIPEHLVNGRLDLGLTFNSEEATGIRYTHLVDEELVLVTSSSQRRAALGSDAARRRQVRLKELLRFPMILPTAAHSLRNCIDQSLMRHSLTLPVVAEVNTIPQLIELAAQGLGSTIVSYASVAAEHAAGRIEVLRISDERLFRPVYLCRSATAPLSIATALVQELIISTATEMIRSGEWPTGFKSH